MVKNIEVAKQLVIRYNDILLFEDRELEDIDVNGGYYMNYGEYLGDITSFNSHYCSLCVSVRTPLGVTKCNECIWSLAKNARKDFKRVIISSTNPDVYERYCININYEDIEKSVYLADFKEILGKRIDKLEQLIKKAELLNKEEENE